MRLPRVRLTLSLRMLLLVILVAALWLGWQANHARNQARAVADTRKYHGEVNYDYEFANGDSIPDGKPWAPGWMRRGMGEDYFRGVARVVYVDQPITDAMLAPLADLPGIEDLRFVKRMYHGLPAVTPPPGLDRLTEAGLSRLGGLTRLRSFSIRGRHLGGSMLRNLNGSPRLQEIHLGQTGITDDGMPPLSAMPQLRVLSLWGNPITGACLAQLRGTRRLEELSLSQSPISSAGIENTAHPVPRSSSLKVLDLGNCKVDDAGVSLLVGLKKLTRLSLDNASVTDAGVVHLSKLTELEWLDLRACKITGHGLRALKDLKQLKRLRLGWTEVDDAGLEVVKGMPRLEVLEIYQTKVTDAGLVHLTALKHLKELSADYTRVTSEGIDRLKNAIPTLTSASARPREPE